MCFFGTFLYSGKVVMYFLISLVSGIFFFLVADTHYVSFDDVAFLILSEGADGGFLVKTQDSRSFLKWSLDVSAPEILGVTVVQICHENNSQISM